MLLVADHQLLITTFFPPHQVCSPGDMVAIDPADLVGKLKMFLCIVLILFAVMHLGAAIGSLQSAVTKRRIAAKVKTEQFAFKEHDDGAWTWRLIVEPLDEEKGVPDGNLLHFCNLVGIPPSRLKGALPEEEGRARLGEL